MKKYKTKKMQSSCRTIDPYDMYLNSYFEGIVLLWRVTTVEQTTVQFFADDGLPMCTLCSINTTTVASQGWTLGNVKETGKELFQ